MSAGTTVKKEMVESTAWRRVQKTKNYILKDRKHKKSYRAQAENVSSRAKYVLFVRKVMTPRITT
jgi:hypothetical protein